MKTLVVYKSNTGFTQRYAQYLGSQLHAEVMPLTAVKGKTMGNFDRVIYGGGLYAGSLNGLKKAKTMFSESGAKEFLVFAVGAMPADSPMLEETWKRNLTVEELKTIPHFYMLGGLDYDHMKAGHKIMMKVAIGSVKAGKDRDEAAETFLKVCSHSFDGFSTSYAEPLLQYLKEKENENT